MREHKIIRFIQNAASPHLEGIHSEFPPKGVVIVAFFPILTDKIDK